MSDQTASYQQTSWSLADLVSTGESQEIETKFSQIRERVNAFETENRAKLNESITSENFLEIIQALEVISRESYHLYGFASLSFAANTQDQNAQMLLARVQQFMAEMQNKTMFFELWWKQLDDADAERLIANTGDYHYWLEEMRHFNKHTLSEPEEKVINIKNVTGSNALERLYDTITNRYTFKLTIDGEEKEMTRGELMVYVRDSDPAIRAQAYQELYRIYGSDSPVLGQIYQTLVQDWANENLDLRNFSSPMSVRNLVNDIPDEVVDTLLAVCEKNSSVFQRYFHLKARWIGMERLRRYDIYAPVAKSDKKYPFDAAASMVLSSFQEFDPEIAGMARRVFEQNHLDSEVRKGKRSGAFCATVDPKITPWVLLNYQGRPDDVSTMAHELGHAVHSMLAADHSLFTFHSSLPLAETASTFAEMVLVDRLLEEESDEDVRRDILFQQVDSAYATIQRQAFFALFERQAHDLIKNNTPIDQLAEAYMENLRTQFGDSIELSDEFRWEWISIPHIYSTPFYVYAYSFGQLLVMALYQQYKQEGQAFIPRYRKILATGGSDAPVRVLADAGIDVRQASFWQGGFDVIDNLVSQLEALPIPR
jgi:oligoendopeptidase F